MNRLLYLLCVTPLLGSGCAPGCSSSNTFSGRTYEIFANPVNYQIENGAIVDAPAFLSYEMPNNGTFEWTFNWGGSDVGAVDLNIDGNTYAGQGDWDTVECGHLLVEFGGSFIAEESGTEHVFNAAANLTVWLDKIGGLLLWNESFVLPDGTVGSWQGTSHMDGTLVSGI